MSDDQDLALKVAVLETRVDGQTKQMDEIKSTVSRIEGKIDAQIILVPSLISTSIERVLTTLNGKYASWSEFKLVEAILLALLVILLGGAAKLLLFPAAGP